MVDLSPLNAPAHKAKHTQEALADLNIWWYTLEWPANSPDLNPIEGVWRIVKSRINARAQRPHTVAEMISAVQYEWAQITEDEIAALVYSMPDRLQAVIDANGGHTRW